LRREIAFPGPVIDRASRARWLRDGQVTLRQRAAREVARVIGEYTPSRLADATIAQLTRLMEREARRHGMPGLPARE
jgi:trimethylamine:corrinoid methyltransferase-like protein